MKLSLFGRLWLRRDVFVELTRRDIESRYSGSFLGLFWSFFNPLLMLAVYTLAFRVFLGMRWPGMASGSAFSLMIFCGMVVHSGLSECITRAPGVIVSQTNLVKRVVFPLAVLPCVMVASTLFNMLLSLLVLLPFTGLERTGQHLQQGGLARAIAAHDAEGLAPTHLEIDPAQCPEFTIERATSAHQALQHAMYRLVVKLVALAQRACLDHHFGGCCHRFRHGLRGHRQTHPGCAGTRHSRTGIRPRPPACKFPVHASRVPARTAPVCVSARSSTSGD